MPTPMITNFTAGMLSPRIEGRIDINRYYNGAKTLENMVVFPYGSATRRPGTQYIATAGCSTYPIRLFPFKFSSNEAYVLEFGQNRSTGSLPGYIRFFKDGKLLDGPSSPSYIKNGFFTQGTKYWSLSIATFTVNATYKYIHKGDTTDTGIISTILSTHSVFTPGTYVFSCKVLSTNNFGEFRASLSDRTGDIARFVQAGTIYATFFWNPSTPPIYFRLTVSYRTVCDITNISLKKYGSSMMCLSPYTSAELHDVRYAQQADVIYMAHPNHPPYKLSRYANKEWSMATFTITSMPQKWSKERGYPQAIAFYEQRLWLGGTRTYPQTIWGSEVRLYESFKTASPSTASRAIEYEIGSSDTIDIIKWLLPHKRLIIGTEGAEWIATSGILTEPITAANLRFVRESSYGSGGTRAELLGNSVIFIGKLGVSIRDFMPSSDSEGYVSHNLALLNDTIIDSPIKEFAYQQDPASLIWAVTNKGKLLCLTFYPTEKVYAWAQHSTQGIWESITSIPGKNSTDELWLSSVRPGFNEYGAATTKRFIERMSPIWTEEASPASICYLDCSGRYSSASISVASISTTHYYVGTAAIPAINLTTKQAHGLITGNYFKFHELYPETKLNNHSYQVRGYTSPTKLCAYATSSTNQTFSSGYIRKESKTITGMEWGKGWKVDILGNGAVIPQSVVEHDGKIQLHTRAADVVVGLGYTSTILSMRVEVQAQSTGGGVSQGHKKRITDCVVRFYKSCGAKCGITTSPHDLMVIPFRRGVDKMDNAVPLFTGDRLLKVPSGYNIDGRIAIVQDQPLPMTILGIIQDVMVGDIT